MTEPDVKIVDFEIRAVPEVRGNGFKVLGTFTLLARPLRIRGCRLALTPDGRRFLVWTPHETVRIPRHYQAGIAETARQAFVEAQKLVAV